MARANGNCSQRANIYAFQVTRGDYIRTVPATCWSAAVVNLYPDAKPISWVEHADHVLVNGEIEVKEVNVHPSCL